MKVLKISKGKERKDEMTSKRKGSEAKAGAGVRSGKKLRVRKETLKDLDAKDSPKIRGGALPLTYLDCVTRRCGTIKTLVGC